MKETGLTQLVKSVGFREVFFILVASVSIFFSQKSLSDDKWKLAVYQDGRGYYAYLPAFFIYHDPSWKFYREATVLEPDTANFLNEINGKPVNKYYCGEALLQLPFFTVAHVYARLAGFPANGYSQPYQYGVAFAALFYFLAGLFFLWKFLQRSGFSERVIFITLCCFAFGTNLFHYAVYEPSMSHIYSFSAVAAFLFFSRSFVLVPTRKKIIVMAMLLGVIAVLRPVNLVVAAAFPFIAGSLDHLKTSFAWMRTNAGVFLVAFLTFGAVCFIQPALYYWQAGRFFLWSYRAEGFDFSNPHISGTLFSYEKGLFIYTPMLLLGVAGLLWMIRPRFFQFISLLVVLVIVVFVVSSWHEWGYGYSFGLRAYVDHYGLLAVPFAFFIRAASARKIFLIPVAGLCLLLIGFYSLQQYQFEKRIIHPGAMNKARYWMVFLHTEKKYEDTLSRMQYLMESEGQFNDMEGGVEWPGLETIVNECAHSGKQASKIGGTSYYSVTFCRNMDDAAFDDSLRIRISAWVLRNHPGDAASLGVLEAWNDEAFFHRDFPLRENFQTGEWEKIEQELTIPPRQKPNAYLRIFFLVSKGTVYIDDFAVEY